MSDASVERYKGFCYIDVSKLLLLLLIWDFKKDKNGKVNGITASEILTASPILFEEIYQNMSEAFKNQTIEVNGNKKKILESFCFHGNATNPLKISFEGICFTIANCVFISHDPNIEFHLSGSKCSPISFLCDAIIVNVKQDDCYKGEYFCFGQDPDGAAMPEIIELPLFSVVDLGNSVPNPSALSKATQDLFIEVNKRRLIDFEIPKIKPIPVSDEAPAKEHDKTSVKISDEAPETTPDDSYLSSAPSKRERIIANVLLLLLGVGGCGLLTFAGISGMFDITSKFMLSSSSYGLDLGFGIIGGVFTLLFAGLTLFRICNTDENRNEFYDKMKDPDRGFFGKIGYRMIGARKIEQEQNQDENLGFQPR